MSRYYFDYSLNNGLGHPAISLYLTGCDKPTKCIGCHNKELQEESKDYCDTEELKFKINEKILKGFNFSKKMYVVFLGGEPLTEYNRNITYDISKYVKEKYPQVTTVVYSWRTKELLKNIRNYLSYMDYGVLGEFKDELYVEGTLPSSSNQYIYDFKEEKVLKPIRYRGGL